MKRILFCLLLVSAIIAQDRKLGNEIPRDTSFTIASTAKKVLAEYPEVKTVVTELPENVYVIKNQVYKNVGSRKLHIDIYSPKQKLKKKNPAVILIHGGGWRSGNKSMESYMGMQLASKGYIAIAVEYRLSIEALYPAAIHDLKSAVNWISKNSTRYKIDKEKITLMGESSGAHLASFLGVTWDLKKFDDPSSISNTEPRINAVINIDGVMDMTTPAESAKDTIPSKPSAAKQWIGYSFKEKPELWREVSPVNYISKNTPPMLFINSSKPRFHAGRDESIQKMNQYSIYSEVHTIENTPHPFWYFHPWVDKAFNYVIKFLEKTYEKNEN